MSEITYSRQGDYLIPDLTLPTEPELPLGRYALMHRDYLEKHKRVTYLSRAGRDRGTERESTDAVGRTDEQHPQPSGGSDTDRTDLQVSVAKEDEVRVNLPTVDEQIEMIAKAEDEKASAFAIS